MSDIEAKLMHLSLEALQLAEKLQDLAREAKEANEEDQDYD